MNADSTPCVWLTVNVNVPVDILLLLVEVRSENPAPWGPVAPVAPAPLTKGAPLSEIVPVFDSANV